MRSIKERIEEEVKNSNSISGWDLKGDNLPSHVIRALKIYNNTASKEEIIYYCLEMMLAYNNLNDYYDEEELKEYSKQILKSIQ